MERFGEKLPNTHEQGKLEKTKPLHVMRTPFYKTMGRADVFHYTLPEEKTPVHILEQKGMRITFSQRDPIVEMLPTHIDEEEGNIVVTSRAHPVSHAEEGGENSPIGGILVSLQEVP